MFFFSPWHFFARDISTFWKLSRAFGHVTGTFFDQCHGHAWNVTGNFFQKCHGHVSRATDDFWRNVTGIFKNCHGQKNNSNKISIEKRAAPKAREKKNWSPKCHGQFFFVTGIIFEFCHGHFFLSRAKICHFCHGHYKNCHGHFLRSKLSRAFRPILPGFWTDVTGTPESVTGKKNTAYANSLTFWIRTLKALKVRNKKRQENKLPTYFFSDFKYNIYQQYLLHRSQICNVSNQRG